MCLFSVSVLPKSKLAKYSNTSVQISQKLIQRGKENRVIPAPIDKGIDDNRILNL